ncbi:MAG: hypothetical protein ACK4TA_26520 [Saprospiraceae bacterium]
MKTRWIVLILVAITLPGCIASLHPLYTKDTIAFRNELLGNWDEYESSGEWKFEKLTNSNELPGYALTHNSMGLFSKESKSARYVARLVKLNEYYFLDITRWLSDEEQKILGDLSPVLPTHTFAKIEITKNKLTLHFFDNEWLEQLFEQQKIRIKHETLEDDVIVLTASSAELQKFVLKYVNEEKAYIDALVLIKKAS